MRFYVNMHIIIFLIGTAGDLRALKRTLLGEMMDVLNCLPEREFYVQYAVRVDHSHLFRNTDKKLKVGF